MYRFLENGLNLPIRQRRDTISLVEPVEIEISGGAAVIPCPSQHLAEDSCLSTSCPSSSADEGYCSPGHRDASRALPREMAEPRKPEPKNVFKVVLTGGPCGGKTTGQERLATFFENLGWKVYTVPECATVLLSGGVKFCELTPEQAYAFQKDLLLTLIRIEDVFFMQAALEKNRKVLVICDRGAMDPSAYIDAESWQRMLKDCNLEQFNLRENRYDQIVHMVTAADGAEQFYTLGNNKTRSEGIQAAMELDKITRNAWVGHPYVDVIDNIETPTFEDKIRRLLGIISERANLDTNDRLFANSKKRKWLILDFDESQFPKYEQFEVKHDYLMKIDKTPITKSSLHGKKSKEEDAQVRIRTRCQNNRTTYTMTRRSFKHDGLVETRSQLGMKEYQGLYRMRDPSRQTIHKKRRCFTHGTQYFNLDIYVDPLPPACLGKRLMILETYTTRPPGDPEPTLPGFLTVEREITGDVDFSMFSLSQIRPQRIPSSSSSEGEHESTEDLRKGKKKNSLGVVVSPPSSDDMEKKDKMPLHYAELKEEMERERAEDLKSGHIDDKPLRSASTAEVCFNEDADDA